MDEKEFTEIKTRILGLEEEKRKLVERLGEQPGDKKTIQAQLTEINDHLKTLRADLDKLKSPPAPTPAGAGGTPLPNPGESFAGWLGFGEK